MREREVSEAKEAPEAPEDAEDVEVAEGKDPRHRKSSFRPIRPPPRSRTPPASAITMRSSRCSPSRGM
jgi:hypothetical protein